MIITGINPYLIVRDEDKNKLDYYTLKEGFSHTEEQKQELQICLDDIGYASAESEILYFKEPIGFYATSERNRDERDLVIFVPTRYIGVYGKFVLYGSKYDKVYYSTFSTFTLEEYLEYSAMNDSLVFGMPDSYMNYCRTAARSLLFTKELEEVAFVDIYPDWMFLDNSERNIRDSYLRVPMDTESY